MPIPSPEDFRNRNKKHSEMREMLAEMAGNVVNIDQGAAKIVTLSSSSININTASSELQLSGTIHIVTAAQRYVATVPQNISIPNNVTRRLEFNSDTLTFELINPSTDPSLKSHVCGYIRRNGTSYYVSGFEYTKDGRLIEKIGQNAKALLRDASYLNFNVSATTPVLTVSSTVRLTSNNFNVAIPPGGYDLPTATGMYRIEYDLKNNVVVFNLAQTVSSDDFITFGYLGINSGQYEVFEIERYQINGSTPRNNLNRVAVICSPASLDFRLRTSRTLAVVGYARLYSGNKAYTIPQRNYDLPVADGHYRVEYDVLNSEIVFKTNSDPIESTHFIFASINIANGRIFVYGIDAYSIDSEPVLTSKSEYFAKLIAVPEAINFDFINRTIVIQPGFVRILLANSNRLISSLTEIPMMSSENDNRWQGLVYVPSTRNFYCKLIASGLVEDEVWCASFRPALGLISGVDHYYINGKASGANSGGWRESNYLVVNGDTDAGYVQSALPEWLTWVNDPQTKHTTVYDLYDGLMASNPNYITKSLLGEDDFGNSIYSYSFEPKEPSNSSLSDNTPKILLFSGVHGQEKAGIVCLYNTLREICENWKINTKLETLRWNAHFVVVPIAVPTSFDDNTRGNRNGVDIARNFPFNWTYNPNTEDVYYAGEQPADQKETQLLDALMQQHKDAIYFGTAHNFGGGPSNQGRFMWISAYSMFNVKMGKALITRITRSWKNRGFMPDDDITMVGMVARAQPGGTEAGQATSYGIQACTVEVCDQFWWGSEAQARFSGTAITLGTEMWVNWLLLNLKYGCDIYNSRFSI